MFSQSKTSSPLRLTLSSLAILLTAPFATAAPSMAPKQDFIVIGGGHAGLVVATRLSEDPNTSVLVLEAGDDHSADPRIRTPAFWTSLMANPDFMWQHSSTPQEGLGGKSIFLPQGKLLGGSSAVNGLAFVPNSKAAVDAWESFGNEGWDWDALEPYFQKCHTLTPPSKEAAEHLRINWIDESVRATDGPVEATFAEITQDPIPAAWMDTITDLGYPPTSDPFAGGMTGVYANPMTVDSEKRERTDSASAYFNPNKARSNLKLELGALVEKIVFSNSSSGTPQATGVQVKLSNGDRVTFEANKEIILAAGAVGSPKTLELSGIGQRKLLEDLDIPVVLDQPNVGENLQDHVNAGLSFEVADGVSTLDGMQREEPAAMAAAQELWETNRTGPFAVGGNYIGSLMPVVDFVDGPDAEQTLQKVLDETETDPNPSAFSPLHNKFVRSILGKKEESSVNIFAYAAYGNFIARNDGSSDPSQGRNFLTVVASSAFPLSRGHVHITSADPTAAPALNPRYLSHPLDAELLARHLRYLGRITSAEPLKSLLKPDGARNFGAPEDLTDLDALKEYARKAALTNYHLTSSCAMLPRENGGVVDNQLRVYGVEGLRIVDSSVIPLAARANPQTTVYAVAERAADLIKRSHGISS